MNIKLLAEQHLEFLSFKRGCTASSESAFVRMPHCWKAHVAAHMEYSIRIHRVSIHSNLNGVARKLKKVTHAHQRDTTGPSNDSLQLHLFSK